MFIFCVICMVIRVDVTRYFPDVTPVEEKVREMRASLRQKISLSLLNAMSLVRNTMHKRDIEDYFYDTTGIFLSRMQTAECRRDDNGNVTMIRLETPT